MRTRVLLSLVFLVGIAIVISACNMPGARGADTGEEPEPTLTPTLDTTGTGEEAGEEEAGEAEATEEAEDEEEEEEDTEEVAEGPCYDVSFVDDVTIPDGTEIVVGTAFDKTWRLVSDGCLPLPAGSQLVFDHGESMGGPASVPVPSVALGQEFDVTVSLTAPSPPDEYTGYWHIVGPSGDYIAQVYVEIVSVAPPEPEETEEPVETEEPGPHDVTLTPVTDMSGHWHGGCADEIEAGVSPGGDYYRGFITFDIASLQGTTIDSATLDLTDYQATSHSFADLGPLLIEQVEYGRRCGQSALDRAATATLESAGHPPEIQTPLDVTTELADWLDSDTPQYFQIRLRWENDDRDFPNGIEFRNIELFVEYTR